MKSKKQRINKIFKDMDKELHKKVGSQKQHKLFCKYMIMKLQEIQTIKNEGSEPRNNSLVF